MPDTKRSTSLVGVAGDGQKEYFDTLSDNITSQPLVSQVASTLRDMIVQDKLKPGTRIRERQLSEKLEVSRTPLREAIRILVSEKLVESIPNRGAVVAEPDPNRVRELLQVLGAMEAFGGRLATENASADEISEIRALHFEMLAAYHRKDKLGYFKLNQMIHKSIIAAGGNEVLIESHAQLNARVYRIRYISNQRNELWHEAIEQHERIIVALEARNGALLETLLAGHLDQTWVKARDVD